MSFHSSTRHLLIHLRLQPWGIQRFGGQVFCSCNKEQRPSWSCSHRLLPSFTLANWNYCERKWRILSKILTSFFKIANHFYIEIKWKSLNKSFQGDSRRRNEGRKIDFEDLNCPAVSTTDVQLIDQLYTFKNYKMKFITGFLGWAVGYVDEWPKEF